MESMSIWLHTVIDAGHFVSRYTGPMREFNLERVPDYQQPWQDTIDQRFNRAPLSVRNASMYAAELDILGNLE